MQVHPSLCNRHLIVVIHQNLWRKWVPLFILSLHYFFSYVDYRDNAWFSWKDAHSMPCCHITSSNPIGDLCVCVCDRIIMLCLVKFKSSSIDLLSLRLFLSTWESLKNRLILLFKLLIGLLYEKKKLVYIIGIGVCKLMYFILLFIRIIDIFGTDILWVSF